MDAPEWLVDLLELADLLVRLGERDDVEDVLERLGADEITMREAIVRLRQRRLH